MNSEIDPAERLWLRLRAAAEKVVRELMANLPAPIRQKLRDIAIVYESAPTPEMIRDGVEPDLMGLFTGEAYGSTEQAVVSPEIHLFLENIWEDSEHDPAEYREQLRVTLLHEIGHYLGLEEEGLAARDLE